VGSARRRGGGAVVRRASNRLTGSLVELHRRGSDQARAVVALPWITRRAARFLAEGFPALGGLDADEVQAVLDVAAESAPRRPRRWR